MDYKSSYQSISIGELKSKLWKRIENFICPTKRIIFGVPVRLITNYETYDIGEGISLYSYVKSGRISIELPDGYKIVKQEVSES